MNWDYSGIDRFEDSFSAKYSGVYFDEEYMNDIWECNYQNPMAYQLLASKCFMRDKYIEAIFYASKAKEILLQSMQFVDREYTCCAEYNQDFTMSFTG